MPSRQRLLPPFAATLAALSAGSCWSAEGSRQHADAEVYPILEAVGAQVTGQRKTFAVERPVDTLRKRLKEEDVPVRLSLVQALDVAAENSREFQRQKEQLYLAALDLTRSRHDFAVHWSAGGTASVAGVGDDSTDVELTPDLGASVTSTIGTQLVASFVNTFLRSVLGGVGFDGDSILAISLTQPLLAGAGESIVREPLTQSERDVVYQMRAFERFRSTFAVQVVSDYYGVVQQMQDLVNVEANYQSMRQSRERTEEEFLGNRRTINDVGRERQSELTASNNRVRSLNTLAAALDRFKITLGLPVTAKVELDGDEIQRLVERGVVPFGLDEPHTIALALERRFDHRTVLDEVEDAARRIVVSEDALGSVLDFGAALTVPSQDGRGLELDWSRVGWAANFQLDLAIDKLAERNAYRSSLIAFDAQLRAREQSEDEIANEIRTSLRNIQAAFDSYTIQVEANKVAALRVESTTELYAAGRNDALEVLDAKDALLVAQLSLTASIVDYAIARLELLRDLEGVRLEPQGLRFDPALDLPQPAEERP